MLPDDEAHIWRAPLDLAPSQVDHLKSSLSIDERKRADRFVFLKDRRRFIVGRGRLRTILARYLDAQPAQLQFCLGMYGKPSLATVSGEPELRFNLSHSRGLALYAVSRSCEIGIDLERIRTDFDCRHLAERFLSPGENVVLDGIPSNLKHEIFLAYWTCKEAYAKATGLGLSLPLDQIDVTTAVVRLIGRLNSKSNQEKSDTWSLLNFRPGSGYIASLAIEGLHRRLNYWQWASRPEISSECGRPSGLKLSPKAEQK